MSIRRARCFGIGLAVLLAVLMSACSAQARRVDCEGRLEAINQPAPKAKDAQSHKAAAPRAQDR